MSEEHCNSKGKIAIGQTASLYLTVSASDTASALGSGSLDVFATPIMIALMEQAACEALSGALEPGQTSVGTKVSVSHLAASPIGTNIKATATVTAVSGRKVDFAVTAIDTSGEIGSGTHTRAIVDEVKFMAKASLR